MTLHIRLPLLFCGICLLGLAVPSAVSARAYKVVDRGRGGQQQLGLMSLPRRAATTAGIHQAARAVGAARQRASVQSVTGLPWGLLASEGFNGSGVKAVYFFAGNWKSAINPTSFYEYPVQPNDRCYTIHPADSRHLGWSERPEYREFALNTMVAAGVNVVTMSYWGEPGTDRWAFWAPMQSSTQAHDQLWNASLGKPILIMPAIESGDATRGKPQLPCPPEAYDGHSPLYFGHSPAYHFTADFPGTLINLFPPQIDPAPQLVRQIDDLVNRYLLHPANPAWPRKWAQLYDRSGQPRYAINILHVASASLPETAHELFARSFDLVADQVFRDTGQRVGFTLDLLPVKHTVDIGEGGNKVLKTDSFIASPGATGPYLRQTDSVLAVQAFISEIWKETSDERQLVDFKRRYAQGWIDQGLPVILDLSPGYDAHVVFAGSARYGNNDAWRNALGQLRTPQIKGISFDTWNGYTEGYAAVPTQAQESGPSNYLWLQHLFTGEPWESHYAYFVNGRPTYVIQGAIYEKWLSLGGEASPLGAPRSNELDAQVAGARFSQFVFGRIYWTPQDGAHEVHGAIYDKYAQVNREAGPLGLPTFDETGTPDGVGRYNHFQNGSIYWSPDTGAHEAHGAIRDKWGSLGWEQGLGYPTTDETATPDGIGRYNHFLSLSTRGETSIYWSPATGAHEVHGAIRQKWAELGWERSRLGYPISDEIPTPDGLGRRNQFQGGEIWWYPDRGAFVR